MIRSTTFLATILFLSLLSCKSQAPKAVQPTSDQTVYSGVTDQACAVEMAFGSYGSGIDGPSFEKILKIIENKKVKYTTKSIGREGETRICLPLTELNTKEKNQLIGQLKSIAKEGQLVSISIR